MSEAIIVAIITSLFTFLGVLMANHKQEGIIVEKINQLEKKVEKHNNLIERMYVVETKVEHIEQELY